MKFLLDNKCLFVLYLLLFLTACHSVEAAVADDAGVAQAVREGLIISPVVLEDTRMAFTTREAREGRLHRQMNVPVQLHFPNTVDLSFERSGGRLSYRNINTMQFVQAGDVLMSVVFDEEALRVEEQQLHLRMREAERRHNSERTRRRGDIQQFRNQLHEDMTAFDLEIHALRLEGMEAEYQHIIHQFQIQRRDQNRRLEEVQEKLQGEDLVAPFDAVVSWVNIQRINTVIEDWMIMATLYDYNAFQLVARGAPDVLRYGDIATITDRDGNRVEAKVVSDPLADVSVQSYQNTFILTPLDPDITAEFFLQSNPHVAPVTIDVEGILIPSRAIHTEDQRRFVYIYEDGIIRKRYIQAGFFYQDMTQVLDGVEAGQLVVLH